MEIWKAIPDHEDYEVSDFGRVRRIAPGRKTFVGKILRDQNTGAGYRSVALTKNGRAVRKYVHRLVALAFLGPPPRGREVNHRDGDKLNNSLANLEYVTRSQNNDHAFALGLKPKGKDHHWWRGGPKPRPRKGRQIGATHWTRLKPEKIARGDHCGHNKVTSAQVAEIRARAASGAVQRRLAAEFGISTAQVCRIIKGSRWA
jgi:hypothetical protein